MGTYKLSGSNNIDSLLWLGRKWGTGNTGTGANVTYRFSNDDSYTPHTAAQQARIREAFNAWSEVANVTFSDVTNDVSASAQMMVLGGNRGETKISSNDRRVLSAKLEIINSDNFPSGSYSYATAVHEIGHALGLKHPHETGSNGFDVIAAESIDSTHFTVMSYRSYIGQPITGYTSQSFFSNTPLPNDIAAIQYIYGANTDTRSSDTVYSWLPGQQIFETVWDTGGIDTIDWSNQLSNANINLNAGAWSELGPAYWNGQASESQTLAIAYNVSIENAKGGSGNDGISGNANNNNLSGEAGNDTIIGGAGSDTLFGGQDNDLLRGSLGDDSLTGNAGDDTLFGGQGNDLLRGSLGDDRIASGVGDDSLFGGQGNDTLTGGLGNDTLTGGLGMDFFTFNATNEGVNAISSFISSDDTIAVSAVSFSGGLIAGAQLTIEQFTLGTAATDEFSRFIYDSASGFLLFDVDGTGANTAVQITTISNRATITGADIVVIA